ncbi:MAG: peptide deformylase [Alphaproteobacteria bacterium]|jgi:peptide deformylase|nr:peptide deformylase [Alphaproteobacteria bacterium]
MALLPVLTAPNPRLNIKATPVDVVDDDVRCLMDDMVETMYANDGMGLAAPQVGVSKRIIVLDINASYEDREPNVMKLVNPEVVWTSSETCPQDEACISVPNVYASVVRPTRAKIRYVDENNVSHEIDTDGLFARCIQHEIDHLDGILYIDHLSRLKKEIILRKLRKARKLQL